MRAHHSFEAHTSEVEIRLEAPSLRELFVEAALALAEVMAGGALPRASQEREAIRLEASDRDALLVDWLNELIFRAERSRRLFTGFAIAHLDDTSLSAEARWAEVPAMRTLVKAATFHGLRI